MHGIGKCRASSEWTYDIGADHEIEDCGDLLLGSHRHVFVLCLECFQEFLADLAILGHFKLDLALEGAVAARLHVKLSTERLLLFAQTIPLFIRL